MNLDSLPEWTGGDIHVRTQQAMTISAIAGMIWGYALGADVGGFGFLNGLILMAGVVIIAMWVAPDAETVALEWRERQRVREEREEGSADD